jgi:hypothetical protein
MQGKSFRIIPGTMDEGMAMRAVRWIGTLRRRASGGVSPF